MQIYACKFDCALFCEEFEERQSCPMCGTCWWQEIPLDGVAVFSYKTLTSKIVNV